ncbi:hypothetical protein Tco_0809903, partial [Tanacetum coccineum]
MAAVEVPQTLEYRGGQLNAAPVLEVENFTNWKKSPFIPMTVGQMKPKNQWTGDERKAANLDQRLKSLIMSILPDDQINFVINCLTAKLIWDDLILYHEGPSDVKESRAMDLKLCYNTFKFKEGESLTQTFTRYKALINELVNDGIKLLKLEINTGFMNGLPKKWLSFCQSLRNTNHVKDYELASLFADNIKVTIPGVERPWLSEVEGFILPNHDTVCSTPLPPLKKLEGVEPISRPKTIKLILKSKSTLKAEALKGVIINKPSSAPAKGDKSSSALKVHLAPA